MAENLERIFNEEGDRIYSLLLYWCRNPDDAADMLQTVFLRFIQRLEKGFEIRNSPRAYLIQIARNLYRDRHRNRKFVTELVESDLTEHALEKYVVDYESREIRELFMECLRSPRLPPEVIEVLEMRFLRHFEMAEICRAVGKSRSSVYRLLQKGVCVVNCVFREAGYEVGRERDVVSSISG